MAVVEIAMFDRFARSWKIAGQCLSVLNEDRSLVLFPLLSIAALLVVFASFGLPIWFAYHATGLNTVRQIGGASQFLGYLCIYLVSYSISTFFNTALVFVALKRMNGEQASVSEGLSAAIKRLPTILGYCLIAATIGAVLRLIEERVGFIGRIITGMLGFAFSIATALVVPILAASDLGPVEAIKESTEMMKRTWGENIIGNAGISFATVLAMLVVCFSTGVLVVLAAQAGSPALALAAGAAGVLAFLLVLLISVTLHSIYTAALYRYASGASGNQYFDQTVLGGAYRLR